jgi:hypothetical protein
LAFLLSSAAVFQGPEAGLVPEHGHDCGRCLIIDDLVDIGHDAVTHQLLDNLNGIYLQTFGQLSDADGAGKIKYGHLGRCRFLGGVSRHRFDGVRLFAGFWH